MNAIEPALSESLIPPALMVGRAALHEFYAATEADAAKTTGVMLALALGGSQRPLLWVRQDFLSRETGTPYPPGLMEFGLDPARLIFVQGRDVPSVLQAGLEGARCAALGGVLIEIWGEARALDLTASRRLALAAKESGTLVLLARVAAQPCPSAAETRWQVQAAPSRALAANAPGNPAVSLSLLRQRGGLAQGVWHLEWNRDSRTFETRSADARSLEDRTAGSSPALRPAAPLSGAVVPASADRPFPPDAAGAARRQAG
jgi:protein ImuA